MMLINALRVHLFSKFNVYIDTLLILLRENNKLFVTQTNCTRAYYNNIMQMIL